MMLAIILRLLQDFCKGINRASKLPESKLHQIIISIVSLRIKSCSDSFEDKLRSDNQLLLWLLMCETAVSAALVFW